MNTNLGLIGKKLGNTQIFDAEGMVHRVTAIECGAMCRARQAHAEQDGYTALVLGFGQKREKSVTKPEAGFFKKLEQKPSRKSSSSASAAEQISQVSRSARPSSPPSSSRKASWSTSAAPARVAASPAS